MGRQAEVQCATQGNEPGRLAANRGYYPDWSPDGSMIVYTNPGLVAPK